MSKTSFDIIFKTPLTHGFLHNNNHYMEQNSLTPKEKDRNTRPFSLTIY
jgi:hypothetical protein